MSLNNLNFQHVEGNLIVGGTLSMDSVSTGAKLDLTVLDTSKVYIIASNILYQELQQMVESFPVNAREVEICDQDGKQVTIMYAHRKKNKCGTIQITISPKNLASHIRIPESKIDPSANYYVDMVNYSQFNSLVSTNLKVSLIKNDLFKFANDFNSININMIVNSSVYEFIEKNFEPGQIPENLNMINYNNNAHVHSLRYQPATIICEEIFGRVISETCAVSQGELFFLGNDNSLQPKFVSGNSTQIKFDMRSNSIHFTGTGNTDFVAMFGITEPVQTIKIASEDVSNIVYENTCQDNYDFTDKYLPKLIDFVSTYQQLVESQNSRTKLGVFMLDKASDIQDVIFDSQVYDFETVKDSFEHIIVSNIINFKKLFKHKYSEIILKDYSTGSVSKKRVLEHCPIGGWMGGIPASCNPDMLYGGAHDGMRLLPHAVSAVSNSMTSMNFNA